MLITQQKHVIPKFQYTTSFDHVQPLTLHNGVTRNMWESLSGMCSDTTIAEATEPSIYPDWAALLQCKRPLSHYSRSVSPMQGKLVKKAEQNMSARVPNEGQLIGAESDQRRIVLIPRAEKVLELLEPPKFSPLWFPIGCPI